MEQGQGRQVSERSLAEGLARGDDAAFEEVVAEHEKWVRGLAYRLMGWDGDAEDVVQEVFLAVLKGGKRFRGQSSVKTWLTTITVNKCRTYRRRQAVKSRVWDMLRLTTREGAAEGAAAAVVRGEEYEQVQQAVGELAVRLREVVVLRYLQEMSIAEVAKVLGISVNAVNARLSRARGELKERLKNKQ